MRRGGHEGTNHDMKVQLYMRGHEDYEYGVNGNEQEELVGMRFLDSAGSILDGAQDSKHKVYSVTHHRYMHMYTVASWEARVVRVGYLCFVSQTVFSCAVSSSIDIPFYLLHVVPRIRDVPA